MRTKIVLKLDTDTNPDPANGPFYTVNYCGVQETEAARSARHRRARQQEYYMAEVNSNPLTKYLYERDQAQEFAARRLAKQSGWDCKPWAQVLRHIKANWDNSGEPTILNSKAVNSADGYSKGMTLRRYLKTTRLAAATPARLNAVERSAEDGDYKVRVFEKEFIEQVKLARNEKGLSQRDLADAINRQPNEIAQFERGELPFDGELKTLLHQEFNF
jgi:DNA-binding XRE family transcriptional regulator